MANEELTRSQYLRALYEQRRLLNANNSVYVNPSVTNQVDIQANNSQEGFDFSFANNIALREKEQELKELQESQNKTEEEKNETALGKIFGFVDEIAAKFGQGFVGAFEGILDLGALGLGAITGDDRFKDWAAINYAERAAEWTKNYGNFTIHGLVNSFEHLDDENYRRNFLAGVFGGPAAAAVQTLRPDTNLGTEYYGGAQDVLQNMGGFGDFMGGAAYSIGFMIPSIMTGGATMAGTGSSIAAKAASLTAMGLSAAGKGGEEAVQQGATAGQALAYGAAKGAVEVASEIVVGKALEGVAKATGLSKYLGSFGKINGVTYSKELIAKAGAKELLTTMVEEGAEEVFSDLFSPLCEAIYKGSDAFKQYGDKDYYKQMALSFASGALIGGLTSGVQMVSDYKTYGKAGVAYLQNNQEFQETYREFQNNQSEANANKCKEILNNMYNQLLEMANNPSEAKHLQNLVEAFMGNNVTTEQGIESLKASLSEDVYQKLVNDVNSIFESTTGKSVSIVPESSLKQVDGAYPKAFISGDSIVINENYKTQLMELIKHEGISHAILDLDTNLRSDLIKAIEKNTKLSAEFHKYDAELEQNYKKSELESERLAKFTEKVLNNYSSFEQALKQSYKSKRLLARFYTSLLDKIAKIKGIDKKYVKTIRTVLSELQGTQTNEQVQTEPQVAYSKDIGSNEYSWDGSELTKEQARYFKDSKVRDSEGHLIEAFHTTNADFTKFEKSQTAVHGDGYYFFGVNEYDNVAKSELYEWLKKGNQVIAFLNITNPITNTQKTMSLEQFKKVIFDTLGSKLNPYFEQNRLPNNFASFAEDVFKQAQSDADLIMATKDWFGELTSKYSELDFRPALKKLGYDGIIIDRSNSEKISHLEYVKLRRAIENEPDNRVDLLNKYYDYQSNYVNEYVAFDSNQIKYIENTKPTEDADMRYAKDTLVGKYTVGSNKMVEQVKKTANGYDIYENGKLVKEGISATETKELLDSWKAKKIVNQKPAKQETSERAKAFQKARETMKEVQNKAKGKKQSKKAEVQTQLKPKIVYKVEPSQPVKIGKNIPVYQLTENGEILVKTVQKVNERNYIVKTRNKATNKVTNKSFDSYKKARESVLKEKNISNVLKDLNKAKTKAEKPVAKPKQSKAERKAEQQVKKAVQAQENIEKRAEPKDTWEGKYITGDNKLACKVVKTSTGYDIYEKGKLLKGYEGITLDELQKFLTENKLRRQAYKQAEERRTKAQEDRAKKTVLGRWLINDGKDELKVNKYQGKYQVHNRNEIIGEYENADQVRAYMQEARAEKYVNLQPKRLNDRFYISRNRTIYVKDGSNVLSKVLAKSDNGFIVTTTNLGDGDVWTKEFTSEKAAKNAIDTFTIKSYKQADVEKAIASQEQNIKAQTQTETKQERKGKKAKAETKVETKPETEEYFKTVETTEDIIKGVKKFVESREGKVQLAFPKNFESFTSKSFTELNSVKKVDVETRKISELLMESTLRAYDEANNEWVKVNKLGDVLSAQEKLDLEKEIKRLIESSTSEKAKSAETKPFQVSIERLANKVTKTVSKTKETRLLTNLRRTIKATLPQPTTINRDNVSRNGLDFMLYPIYNLKGQNTYSQKGVIQNFNEVKKMYEEIGKNPSAYPDIPYYPEVSQMIDDVIDSIGEPTRRADGVLVYGNMSSQTEHLIRMYGETVKFINNQVKAKIIQNYQPSAIQTLNVMANMKYGTRTDIFAKLFRSYKRGFAPSYYELRQMFGGNSRVAQLLTTDYQNAQNSKQVYYGAYSDAIKAKLKELGIKRQFNKRQFNVNGSELTTDQAMYLYISSNVEANFNAMDENGVKYYDKNGRTRTLAEKGNAEALKKQVADVLPKNYKQFADWLLNTMNDSVKAEYMNWYEQRFGKYNRRNEIGAIKENKYWSLRRAYEKMNSVEAAVSNPEGVFSNAKSRVNNDNAVMIGGALSTFTTYIDKLGTELYLKPIYREAIATLNTKIDGKSIVSTMAEKLDPQDSRYLTKTMDDMVGALKNTNDIFTGVMSRFSVAKLSLNLGTMGKQFASIFTSNIPIYSSVQGFVHRWSETFKNEYQTLIDGVKNEDGTWKTEPIGGLKYRNGSNIVRANADSLSQLSEKIAEAGMIGITGVDKFTINTGVFSLMMIGQNEFGLKVGTQANIDFVREQWHEFELSQIGSGALSKNALGRGDYGSLAKGLFGFLQGANRAALGSQLNKIDLWRRNRGLTKVEVENARDSARKAVTEYEESHKNKEGKFQTTELEVEEQERYVKLVAAKMDAEAKYDDFIKYRVAGGRAIPVNLAAGLIAQGLFVTLINELMKRIKGRKEWDEVDVAELGLNTALAIGVDWVPFVNTISSMIKGYDVQVPAVEIFKEIGEVLSNATQGNWQKTIRELALLIGDSTGIPFQTIYDYLYGTIKAFDVGTAEEFKSVLYGLTPQSATKTLNHYVEKKNEKKVLSMLNVVLDNYRVNTSDSVKSEMAKLLIDGKEVLPQQFMTSYEDENGEKVELSAEQIKVFRKYYDQADEAAQKLISSSSYKSLDNDRKAKLLKKLYSHYYAFAKYQVAKIEPSSRLGKLLVLTNGNLDLANYLVYLEDLGNIVATKTKTKKELAIKYINKISGKSKGEKLLLMLLAGYSVADNEKNKVIGQLVKLGMTRKQAKEFVG